MEEETCIMTRKEPGINSGKIRTKERLPGRTLETIKGKREQASY